MKFEGNGLYVQATDPNAQRGPTYLALEGASAELPSEIAIGLSYQTHFDEENALLVSSTFQNNNYAYDDYKFGIEYSFRNLFFVRGGYLFSPQATDDNLNIFENYALGLGVNLKEFSNLDIQVDYAFVPVEIFDANHVFSISLGF